MKKIIFILLSLLMMSGLVIPVFSSSLISLSQEEKDFIQAHPTIYLGVDPSFVPYEFIDIDKSYNGIAKDYIELISQKTGLVFEVVPNLTWEQAYEKGVLKQLDVLPCVSKSEDREKYFLFSQAYYQFQRVIFISNNSTVNSFGDLAGKTVAVQKNSSHHEFLKAYPLIQLHLYDSVQEALEALNDGLEEVFIGNLITTLYLSKKAGYSQLKYIDIPSQKQQSLYFAVRNDYPILVSILNKGLSAITQSEKIEINNRWIGTIESKDNSWLIQLFFWFIMFAGVILLVSLFWVFRLKKEIDQRKIVELDLKYAKEEADRANQIKSSFLARMSHEIRTPLNAVTGMSYILRKSGLTLTQQSYLDKITAASKDVLEIINDILDFSKIESGKVSLENISFNLDEILEHLVTIVSFKVEEQGIDLKIERDPSIPLYFVGDPKRLQQILLNLLNNSVKFTEKGSVTLKMASLGRVEDKLRLVISVEDTGIGMTEDQIKVLFTPFTQADNTITRRFGGTGLGLSIVKSLLDLMGGSIEVNSHPSNGSSFVVTLDLLEDHTRNEALKRLASELYLGNIKTLILDKQQGHAQMIQDYLRSFNLVTDIFTDTQQAQHAIEAAFMNNHPYHLLILDDDTPPNKGLQFSSELNKTPWIRQSIKIILMISFNSDTAFDQLDHVGIGFGINKPIIPSVLFNGIVDLFRQNVAHRLAPEANRDQSNGFELTYPYSILLCEDNKTNQFIAKSILEQAGYTLTIADNGQVGVDLYRQQPEQFDIILMDLHMPIKNGYEAAQEIRVLNSNIPIVAMTADAITGVDQKCAEVGITHYISKPFDPSTLSKTVFDLILNKKEKPTYSAETSVNPEASTSEALDSEAGMRNVGGNVALYHKILKIFLRENQETSSELQKAIDTLDYVNAIQIVHKIKGSCGTIGAPSLYQNAIKFQKALQEKDNENMGALHVEFDDLLSQLLDTISHMDTKA